MKLLLHFWQLRTTILTFIVTLQSDFRNSCVLHFKWFDNMTLALRLSRKLVITMQCDAFSPPFHPTALIIARSHLQPPGVIGRHHSSWRVALFQFYFLQLQPADGPSVVLWSPKLPLTSIHPVSTIALQHFKPRFYSHAAELRIGKT